MTRYQNLLFALLALPVAAGADCAVAINVGSYHFDRSHPYNERNYGAGVECGRYQAGLYKNSEYRTSVYAFRFFELRAPVGIAAGLVTGYEYADVLPAAALTVTAGPARVLVMPPMRVDGRNVGAIGLQLLIPFQHGGKE